MTKQISIRGVIVDGWYDGEWASQYIERGLWTPESRFRAQVEAAQKAGDDVDIYISSQGGSVVAGNDILACINGASNVTGITVGAFAASMAANIVLQAGVPVKAHKNSLFLFHGAWGVTIGGEGAHTDTATMLDQINEPIMKALKALGVPQDKIDEGFAEGRQFTMTADEAKQYGIVHEIIGEVAAPAERMTEDDTAALLAQGATLDVAACSAWQSADIDSLSTPDSVPPPVAGSTTPPPAADADTIGRLRAELAAARSQASSIQSALDKRIAAMTTDHAKALSDLQTQHDSMKAEYASFRQQAESDAKAASERIAGLEANLKQAKDQHAALSGQALLGDGDGESSPASWPEAVDKFGIKQALRKFPQLAQEFKTTHQPKK